MDHRVVSARGGNATKAKHGREFYSRIGKLGAASKLKKYGQEYFISLSKQGVEARKAKQKAAVDNTTGSMID